MAKPTTRMQYSWLLGGLGSVALVAAMWAPFYHFNIPLLSQYFQQLGGQAQQFGVLAPLISSGAAALAHVGALDVKAWTLFDSLKIVWLGLGGVAFALTLLSYTGRARGVGRFIASLGAVAFALVAYRMVARPLSHELLSLGWGAWLMLLASAAIIASGRLYDGSGEGQFAAGSAGAAASPPAGEIRSWPAS